MMQVMSDYQRLGDFSAFLADRTGLHYPAERWPDLERAVAQMAAELGFASADACMRHFLSTPVDQPQIETLASHLTIGETYFFREPASYDALATRILPDLIAQRRAAGHRILRIWSAACSTGEEAYSMAILLDRLLPDLPDWTITLLATDINPRSLRKAVEGRYGEWSFRGVDPEIRRTCFIPRDGRTWEVVPHIRRMVSFAYHNLAEDQYPSVRNNTNAMDIIFCRNVLMYFSADRARRVVTGLQHCLVDGGWLVAAAVEGSAELFTPLVNAGMADATLYRKCPMPVPAAIAWAPPPDAPAAPLPATLAPAPAPAPPPDAPTAVEQARRLYQAGENGQAIALLRADPDTLSNGAALTLLARLYANDGHLDLAEESCRQALAIDRLAPERHYLLALIQQERGDARGAAESLKRALYADPDFILAHVALAGLAMTEGRRAEARRCHRNALGLLNTLDPSDKVPEGDGLTAGRLIEIIRVADAEMGA